MKSLSALPRARVNDAMSMTYIIKIIDILKIVKMARLEISNLAYTIIHQIISRLKQQTPSWQNALQYFYPSTFAKNFTIPKFPIFLSKDNKI